MLSTPDSARYLKAASVQPAPNNDICRGSTCGGSSLGSALDSALVATGLNRGFNVTGEITSGLPGKYSRALSTCAAMAGGVSASDALSNACTCGFIDQQMKSHSSAGGRSWLSW